MAARFAGMLCRREVLNSTFGVKALRTSSSFSTSSFSSSSLLLNSSSSSLAGVSRESGLRSCGLSPHILSSSFVQYRIVSEKKGTTDYVHGSLTEAAAEVTSRTPRVVAFKSVLEEVFLFSFFFFLFLFFLFLFFSFFFFLFSFFLFLSFSFLLSFLFF